MRPVEYLRLIRQRWWVLPITALLGFVIAFATQPTPPRKVDLGPLYKFSATTVLAAQPLNSSTSNVDYDRLALLATAGQVPQNVALSLGLGGPTNFAVPNTDPKGAPIDPNKTGAPRGVAMKPTQVIVTPNKISGSLTIEATAPNINVATAVANAIGYELMMDLNAPQPSLPDLSLKGLYNAQLKGLGNARGQAFADLNRLAGPLYVALHGDPARAKTLLDEFVATRQRIVNLDRTLIQLIQNGPSDVPVLVLSAASPANTTVIFPDVKEKAIVKAGWPRLTLGAGIGLLAGIALILLIEVARPKIRDVRSAENAALMPAVAEISAVHMTRGERYRVVAAEEPSSLLAEAYRSLRTSLLAMWPRHPANARARANGNGNGNGNGHDGGFRPLRTLLVTSPGPSEGKSVTAVNLAATFAETGASVIVIDGDARRPAVHRYFGGRSTPNLADFEHGPNANNLEAVLQDTKIDGVQFAASARGIGPARTVAAVKAAAAAAMELADVVIIDAPPLLVANDSSELATAADASLFVVRAGKTRRESATRGAELLRRIEARVVGVVVVGVERSTPDGFYGYSSHYGSTLDVRDRDTISRLRPWSRRRSRRARDLRADATRREAAVTEPTPAAAPVAPAPPAPGSAVGTAGASTSESSGFVDLVAHEGDEADQSGQAGQAPPAEAPEASRVDEPWSHIFERRPDAGDGGDTPPGPQPPGS